MKPLSSQLGLPLLVLLVGVICVTSCGGPKKKPAAAAGRSMPKGRSAAKTPIPLKQRGRALSIPKDKSEESGRKFMQELEPLVNEKCAKSSGAVWNFVTNLSPANQELATNASLEYSEFRKVYWKTLVSFPWKSFKNKTLKRQFFLESTLSTDILSSEKIKELADLINKMKEIYSTAKVCDYKINTTCDLSLDPDITDKLAESRDYDELEYYWVEWREASGKKMPHYYKKYVDLANEGAKLNGYHDMGELWRRPYENELLHLEVWSIWGQIRPLYEQLHAYTRKKLRDFYKRQEITADGSIPAHILGNMWSQNWANIYGDLLIPYKNAPNLDITKKMRELNYTTTKMFRDSDEFFQSIGLIPMNEEFWKNSIFDRPPPPREIVCHPEAYDLCNKQNFFIKQCATVTMRDYITAHHEMGHIQYYMQYKDQLNTFREGANPGFHEAIGDTISMSVSTPKHLKVVGLLDHFEDNKENTINFLMSQALKVLVDIPWALTLEQWRWDIFSGKVTPEDQNCHWWKLRSEIQGVRPPVSRSSTDFDPGAKFHVPSSVPYDRYFVARILTYQFHEALCRAAGQYAPEDPSKKGAELHKCDIYKSKEAGEKLGAILKLGSSKPWPEALEMVTGTRRLDAKAVLNYYAPLMAWLQEENAKTDEYIGWIDDDEEKEQFCIKE